MVLNITNYDLYIGIIINSTFTGIGVALGTYLVNSHILDNLRKIKKKLKIA